ncbi:MAG TPA: histone deacetylase family protein [Rhizomicrobium sp.]|jgi:acetoin utilization deacetylase AcuC-like enzyme|nr:histone deacetylase family protein [Rhizomicrobium sp.]
MKTFYSPAHLAHAPKEEFEAGRLSPAVEIPERAERVRAEIERRTIGPILLPDTFGDEPILRVHDGAFLAFLRAANDDWRARYPGDTAEAIPSAWPARGMRFNASDIEARLGSYASDTATPIGRGTFEAARAAVDVVVTAADQIKRGDSATFALTRPPGHHARADVFGGYCYLNNVAIAAQWLADHGLRPTILDVDYHHGNGTQSIFYDRSDVLFVSVHADPAFAYPHFLGFADECGKHSGEGFNLNLPLPRFTEWDTYSQALATALMRVRDFGPNVLLVSLGLDTFEADPISHFRLKANDYLRMGEAIAQMRKPTLFVFEGGYNLDALANITVNVLEGFEQR